VSYTTVAVSQAGGDGEVHVTPSGGYLLTGTYSYSWSNGAMTKDLTGLDTGTYIITVFSDSPGEPQLSFTKTTFVLRAGFGISYVKHDCTTYGGSDGGLDITISGGLTGGVYSQLWDDGSTELSRSSLSAGTYTLVLSYDVSGQATMSDTSTFVISEPISITSSVVPASEVGMSDGQIDISVAGGFGNTSTYTYAWTDGPTTQDRNTLGAGNYTLTVTSTEV
jgi:uncharacterized protein (DUF2141 family)